MDLSQTAEITGIIRDVLLIVVFLLMIAVLLVVWRSISSLFSSIRRTVERVEQVTDTVAGKFVKPAAAGSGVAFGLGKIAAFARGMRGKKKKRKNQGGANDG